jgi:hypothetical protein
VEELAKALAKAQSIIGVAVKDAKNPHFKSSYATLASTWDALRKPLTDNGLSVIQYGTSQGSDEYLVTKLIHTSGQFVESHIKLINQKGDMQGLGSAWSYARRYGLQAIAGIAQDDDDGNAASVGQSYTPPKAAPTPEPVPWPDAPMAPTAFNPKEMWEQMKDKPVNESTRGLVFPFGKLKGKPLSEADESYIDWMLKDLQNPDRKYPIKPQDKELVAGLLQEKEWRKNNAPKFDVNEEIPF